MGVAWRARAGRAVRGRGRGRGKGAQREGLRRCLLELTPNAAVDLAAREAHSPSWQLAPMCRAMRTFNQL